MKPQLLTLFLILALPFTGHTASEWTITKKHRVIQEASVQPSNVPIGTKISRLTFTTLRGDTHNLDTLTAQGPVVFAFLATECPVAQRYTMRLKQLHAEFAAQTNTTFVAVYANENDSEDEVKNYVAKADHPFLVVKDTTGKLARALGATMTQYQTFSAKTVQSLTTARDTTTC
jgi:peroxiredoxin